MGKFDDFDNSSEYSFVERIGTSRQAEKLPMKSDADAFRVKMELDTVKPDILLNFCKEEADGEKHQLIVFYCRSDGKMEWIPVAVPRYRMRKYSNRMKYIEVIDCRTGKRKTFKRSSIKSIRRMTDRFTGEWRVYSGRVDGAGF